jgi:hypothetical protein
MCLEKMLLLKNPVLAQKGKRSSILVEGMRSGGEKHREGWQVGYPLPQSWDLVGGWVIVWG